MKIIWHFNDDEHKKEFENILIGCLAQNAIERYPKEMDAAVKYLEKGLLTI